MHAIRKESSRGDSPREGESPPQKAEWRKRGASATVGQKSRGQKSSSWRDRKSPDTKSGIFGQRLKVATWVLLLACLLAAFIKVVLWFPTRTPIIALAVTEYDDSLIPPNAYAQEDIERLSTINQTNINFTNSESTDVSARAVWTWLREKLDEHDPGGPSENVVILYLSAHGVLDEHAEPHLLLSDSDPRDSDTWLPITELLENINDHYKQKESIPKIVLILDAGRIHSNWSLGVLYNGFADRLAASVEEVNVPNLVVLNSTRHGQTGWSAPELGESVFGYFLARGLAGAADTGDGMVSLHELSDYLQKHVDRWVSQRRSARQQPILIQPEGMKDFPLTYAASDPPTLVRMASRPEESDLDELWKKHERVEQQAPYLVDPVGWAELQQKLVRLERLMLAGKAYRGEFERTLVEVDDLLSGVGQDSRDLKVYSLPLAMQLDNDVRTEIQNNLGLFDEWRQLRRESPPKSDDLRRNVSYLTAAGVVREWLAKAGRSADAQDLHETLEFIGQPAEHEEPELIEVHFWKALRDHLHSSAAKRRLAKLIQVRHLAELSAAPSDVRAHHWNRPIVKEADQKRRLIEDKLFIGNKLALQQADRLWIDVSGDDGQQGLYGDARQLALQVSQAYRVRDEAWAKIPYLAQWLVGQQRAGNSKGSEQSLFELIEGTHELGAKLDEALAEGGWNSSLEEDRDDLRQKLEQLEKMYGKQYPDLMKAAKDEKTLRKIDELLQVSLLTGDKRNLLRDRYLRILFHYEDAEQNDTRSMTFESASEQSLADEQGSDDDDDLYVLGKWSRHPALAILDRTSSAALYRKDTADTHYDRAGQLRRQAQQGGEVRNLLLTDLPRKLNELSHDTDESMQARIPAEPIVVRARLSEADRMNRAAAGLLAERSGNHFNDPTLQLNQVDRYFQLLWHCRRTLEDFWGPSPPDQPAYFDTVAQAYLSSARSLHRDALGYREALVKILESRREAAGLRHPYPGNGVQPWAEDLVIDKEDSSARQNFKVTWPDDMPSGEAAVYACEPEASRPADIKETGFFPVKPIGDAQSVSVGNKESSVELEIPFSNDSIWGNEHQLEAFAFYRGHVRTDPFYVRRPGEGYLFVHERPQYGDPTVKVVGNEKQKSWVTFILDVSSSMGEKLRFEGRNPTRLEVAKNRLELVLRDMQDDQYRIGVMFYGHRAGWHKLNGRARQRWNNDGDRERGLHPSEDVDWASEDLRMRRGRLLDDRLRDEISRRLAPLEPFGETPLYYALTKAIDEFGQARIPAGAPRHIIVITDGVNQQSTDGPNLGVVKDWTDVRDLLRRARYQDVRIDLVGFQLKTKFKSDTERATHQQGLRRIRDIASLAKGEFHNATNPGSLRDALEKSLGLVEFYVDRPGERTRRNQKPKKLGKIWTVELADDERWDGTDREMVVKLVGADGRGKQTDVKLGGGEAIELFYEENRLKHRRYDYELRENPQTEDVPDPMDPDRGFFIGKHLPVEIGNQGISFPISVQNADEERFSPRPKHVWAEIQPVFRRRPKRVPLYPFYDLDFEPYRPVPVLRFRVPSWPQEARQAQIRLWFKLDDHVQPNKIYKVVGTEPAQFDVEDLPGVKFAVETKLSGGSDEPYQVFVTEDHETGSNLYSVRVQMTPPPDRVSRRYIVETMKVRHVFEYNDASLERKEPRIHITAKDRITKGAVEISEPIVVDLPN